MKYLIDTHTFIWYLENNPHLSAKAKIIIENEQNNICLSIASLWEIAIKVNVGKLTLNNPIEAMIAEAEKQDFTILPISRESVLCIQTLPLHHRDPFDRILIAQSLTDNLPILTVDSNFAHYPIAVIW